MPIEIRVSTSVTDWFEPWKQLWTRENGDPFLHPAWSDAFEKSRVNGVLTTHIIGAWLGSELVGVLPLRRDPDGVLRFLTSGPTDYEDALCSAGHGEQVVSKLAEALRNSSFELHQMPQDSLLARALQERGVAARPSAPCPGIRMSEDSVRDVTSRKSLRRHEKKLGRLGPVSLDAVAPPEVEEALCQFFEQHIARRLLAGDQSLFLDPQNRDFYARLTRHHDFNDFGAFHVLRAGERNAAFHVALKNRETFIWYKPSFDMNLESDGPGEVLLKTLVEHAWGSGLKYFDFSRGNEAFKLRFANEHRTNQAISHRLPLQTLLSRVRARISSALARRMKAWNSGLKPTKPRTASRCMAIEPPAARPDPPTGCEIQVGEPDLVMFGAMSAVVPEYVTTERMRLAVERRRQGDWLMVVRNRVNSLPLCFAWLRFPLNHQAETQSRSGHDDAPATAVIFDCWQHPTATAIDFMDFSMRYLASLAAERGLRTVFNDALQPPDSELTAPEKL